MAEKHWSDVNGQRRIMYSAYTQEDAQEMGVLHCHNSARINELIGVERQSIM